MHAAELSSTWLLYRVEIVKLKIIIGLLKIITEVYCC